jgi:hypothetical protein
LLRCYPLSGFIIARRHATANVLVAGRFLPPIIVHCCHRRRCHCRQAATTSIATNVVKLTVAHCQRKSTAAAPPAYQWQNQCENVYKSRQLGLI